jgi:hypothetical protein
MQHLPSSYKLPIDKLSACFNNTTATYKYYWLLSIIEQLELGKKVIPKIDLFAGMVANSWYTINYFKVSFGKYDMLQEKVELIKHIEQISINAENSTILSTLINSSNIDTIKALMHFDKNVPYRFLSPWFPNKSEKEVYQYSSDSKVNAPYTLKKDSIVINDNWVGYLIDNAQLIKSFCLWNLTLFLQSRNPSVPDIANKLIKPAKRNSLSSQKVHFWDLVIEELEVVKCIYVKKSLRRGEYDCEHFIPYSFVAHDLIWNLIPADKSFNSSKSNKLPNLEKYFNSFFNLHKSAVDVIKKKHPNSKYLEEYLTIFPDLDFSFNRDNFRNKIQPLVTIAANNGFEYMS